MIIDASISLRDLKEDYHVELPESPDYETLGGLLITLLQKMPQVGDEAVVEEKRLRVVEMVGKRIAKVRLQELPSPPKEEVVS
jgi:putative hemolysin